MTQDRITVKKQKLNDGDTLRVIHVGLSLSCVIHPENWEEIASVIIQSSLLGKENNPNAQAIFTDEQGWEWVVTYANPFLHFTCLNGAGKFRVDAGLLIASVK